MTKHMRQARRLAATALAVVLGVLAGWIAMDSAEAHHNAVDASTSIEGCTLEITSSWTIEDHTTQTTRVVALVGGEVKDVAVGETLTLDLPAGTQSVKWRVWGGGERDYDSPVLADLNALLEYLETEGNTPLDANAPGVSWYTVTVEDCPEPTPSPSVTTPAATTPPATPPATDPAATPSGTVPPVAGGPSLPVTGVGLPQIVTAGILLLIAGAVAYLLSPVFKRRRRTTFEA
jgi:hypothetical protein